MEPLAPERYALQVTVGQATYDKLRHAQALLAHALPSGELSEVLDRALDALIERLEKRKFEATARPRNRPGTRGRGRHVPAEVKRAVRERDGGQCTFVSASGRRCEERRWLEFDHVHPVARGGEATLEGVRLRCRAHNQYTAECTYGAGFMQEKRDQARRRTEEARRRKAAAIAATPTHSRVQDGTPEPEPDRDVTPWLRSLGYRAEQARHGAALCEAAIPEAPIEQKLRFALGKLTQGLARKTSFAPANPA